MIAEMMVGPAPRVALAFDGLAGSSSVSNRLTAGLAGSIPWPDSNGTLVLTCIRRGGSHSGKSGGREGRQWAGFLGAQSSCIASWR
jgi:hypothetical protein